MHIHRAKYEIVGPGNEPLPSNLARFVATQELVVLHNFRIVNIAHAESMKYILFHTVSIAQ